MAVSRESAIAQVKFFKQLHQENDAEAKVIVADLLRETEIEAIDAGALKNTRYIEPAGMLLVQLAHTQQMGQIAIKLLQR